MKDSYKKVANLASMYATRWVKPDTGSLWIVSGISIFLLGLLAFLGVYDRPIADDFTWIHQAHTMSVPGYMHQQLWFAYGRYGNALALALLGKIFYTASVTVAPLALILILVASAYYTSTAFGITKLRALAISLASTAFLLTSVPSIFDVLYWLNSSTLYPLAIAGSMLVAGSTVKMWTAGRRLVLWKLSTVLGIAFLVGGINEFSPVINTVIIALVCIAWRGKRYPWRSFVIGAMVATQFLAFAILKWAPGSIHRQTVAQSGATSLLHVAKHSLLAMGGFIPSLTAWNIVLIVVASITIAITVYRYGTTKFLTKEIWRKVAALFVLATTLYVIPVIMTQYARSIRDNDQPPYRAQIYLVAGLMLALTTLIWLLCTAAKLRSSTYKNIALVVLVVFGLGLSIARTATVGQAMTTRAFLYDQRLTIADLQIKSGKQVLLLPEVPIYAVSDAQDLPPTNDPAYFSSWVSVVMAEYLGVKQVKTDDSKSLESCPAVNNWYMNQLHCKSVYKAVAR